MSPGTAGPSSWNCCRKLFARVLRSFGASVSRPSHSLRLRERRATRLRAFTNHETTCSTLSPEAQGCSSCRQRPTGRVARLVPHAAHRTRGCHTAGWQVLTCARSQLGFDAAIRIRVVVVCRNPRLEQHRGGRRVVVWWTRGLAVCAWLGSLFSVEGAVQKEAVVDTVMSQRGGLRCAQRSWRARVATLDPTDVLFGRCARSLPGLLHPRLAKLRLGQGAHLWSSSRCDARAWLLRQVCARALF